MILCFTIFVLGGLVTSGLTYKQYSEYKSKRVKVHAEASAYLEHYCKDPHVVSKTNAKEDCDKRRDIHAQDPTQYAIYDVLKDWNVCKDGWCSSLVVSIANNLVLGCLCVVAIFCCIVCLCGRRVFTYGKVIEEELFSDFGMYHSKNKQN